MVKDDRYIVEIGESDDPQLVGGKGASLTKMIKAGLVVPRGFTITIPAWKAWKSGELPLKRMCDEYIYPVVDKMFPRLGDTETVSVRSGAAQSMPGMMETILHVGANDLRRQQAYLMSFIKARDMDMSVVDSIVDKYLIKSRTFFVSSIESEDLVAELSSYAGVPPYESAKNQIKRAVELVFESWNSAKAKSYRKIKGISNSLGTACTIQKMVDARYGFSGVMLTRGEIDWMTGVQGDVIVDGSIHTMHRSQMSSNFSSRYGELVRAGALLESIYHDAMDVEFTYDGQALNYLQCRPAKRSSIDAMRIAVELHMAGIYSNEQVMAVPVVDDSKKTYKVTGGGKKIGKGTPINGKTVSGKAHIDPIRKVGPDDIVFREITTTSDIDLMTTCRAVVTLVGGPTCHAALVASELNTTVFVGVSGVLSRKDGRNLWMRSNYEVYDGDEITILQDGSIYPGDVNVSEVSTPGEWSGRLTTLQESILNGEIEPPPMKTPRKRRASNKTKIGTLESHNELEPIPF